MALPVIRAVGAVAAGTGAISPGLPAGTVAGDLLIMMLETGAEAITVTDWLSAPSSPQETGNTRLTILYKISVDGADATTTSDSGDHQIGRIIGIQTGTFNAASPFNTSNGNVQTPATTSVSIDGATTSVADCLILAFTTNDVVSFGDVEQYSSWANVALANVAELIDNRTTAGNDGQIGAASGEKATAGAYGATTATAVTSAVHACISLAIAPAAAAGGPFGGWYQSRGGWW
jgi:hypothetical protein